jgi:hypothetical protein
MGGSRRLVSTLGGVLVALGVTMLAGALTGCGTQLAGSAAVAGDQRLTDAEVSDQIDELDALYAASPETQRLSDDQLTQAAISWWLNVQVLERFAAENDLTVTEAQVDEVLGAADQRTEISMGAGVAPSQLESAARALVTYQLAFEALAAGGGSQQDVAAALAAELELVAKELDVSVNPRFGSGWVPGLEQQLAPRNPERLSAPALGSEPLPLITPEQ